MKHSIIQTFKLLSWMFASILLAIVIAPYMQEKFIVPSENPYLIAGISIGLILAGAVGWYFLMKKFEPTNIEWIFAVLIAYGTTNLFQKLLLLDGLSTTWKIIISLTIYISVLLSYHKLIKKMQESWMNTRRLIWISNLFWIVLLATMSAVMGAIISPIAAILILAGAAIYDWVAVNKIGTMVLMAKYFLDRRIIPGIALAKETEGEFAILGGGDIFFISLVATSFFKSSIFMMWVSAICMSVAIVILFFMSQKKKFYPALPFIFAGLLIALVILLMKVGGGFSEVFGI